MMKKGRVLIPILAAIVLVIAGIIMYSKPATQTQVPKTDDAVGKEPLSSLLCSPNTNESLEVQEINFIDYGSDALPHDEQQEELKIDDSQQIAELIDELSMIDWVPKAEGDWPKYSVLLPDYSIEIHTSTDTLTINLFDTQYVAVLANGEWQRYEISESDYNLLKQHCQINKGGV